MFKNLISFRVVDTVPADTIREIRVYRRERKQKIAVELDSVWANGSAGRPVIASEQPLLLGDHRRLSAVRGPDLTVERLDMQLHRRLANVEIAGDFLVRLSVGEQLQILKGVMARLYKDLQDPAYVDLRYAGQVVVGNSQAPS